MILILIGHTSMNYYFMETTVDKDNDEQSHLDFLNTAKNHNLNNPTSDGYYYKINNITDDDRLYTRRFIN